MRMVFVSFMHGVQPSALSKVAWMEGAAPKTELTNQAVQGQSLSENENQDHTHEQLGLLSVGPAEAKHSTGVEQNISTCMRSVPAV